MKKSILTFAAFGVLNLVFAQTTADFLGIPMMKDFNAGAKVLEEKGFEIIGSANDSILLAGSLNHSESVR